MKDMVELFGDAAMAVPVAVMLIGVFAKILALAMITG